MSQGWISLHRKLQDSKVWLSEKFTRGQAWVDLLMLANHKDKTIFVRGIEVIVRRGQIGRGERNLAERWRWSRGKVRRYLKWLEGERQITQQKSRLINRITIINYNKYQRIEQQITQQITQQTDQNNNVNNENKKEVGPVQLKNGSFYLIPKQDIERWKNTYTHIDVPMILKEIVEWNHNNPKKRKTQGGISKHITTWLARENKEQWEKKKQAEGSDQGWTTKPIAEVIKERGF